MRFLFIFIITLFSLSNANCQSKSELISKKTKLFFLKNTPWGEPLYINKASRIIQFGPYQVPLDGVRINYQYNDKLMASQRHFVQFSCLGDENCVLNEEGKPSHIAVSAPFKTKSACYDFMDLLKELKDSLK